MRQFIVALSVALLAAMAAHAQEIALPDSVAQPYLAYEDAVERQDYRAASLAAEQAFAAARESGLPEDLQLTLGLNALAMAPSRGTGSGLVELARATAALADQLDDRQAGFDAWLSAVWAASSSRNYVAFDALYAEFLTLTAADRLRYSEWLVSVARIENPRYSAAALTPEAQALAALELERARAAGDAVAVANAAISLQRHAVEAEDWAGALDLTRTALTEPSVQGAAGRGARDAVALLLSDILRDGFGSTDSGEAHLSGDARSAWCDYLTRWPVALDYIHETPMPMRAVERSIQGVVRTEFTIPAAGGLAVLGESQTSSPGMGVLQRASRNHLAETHFRPGCTGQTSPISGVLLEGFAIDSARRRGSLVEFGMRVFMAFTE